MRLPLLVLVGPTAVGKTAVSIAVAERLNAEIISGDSMQVYRGMDIGTAKITPAEMRGIPHHMIDIRNPDEPFSVAEFRTQVDRLVREIVQRRRLPFLVGGTGLYVRAVLQEYMFSEQETNYEVRARLAREAAEHEPGWLHARLAKVDPEAAVRIHPNDQRRIIRALEVYETTGVPISCSQIAAEAGPRYDDLMFGLSMEREALYRRIDQRVDLMLANGFVDEVLGLLQRYPPTLSAMRSLGYRELFLYLRGLLTWDEAVSLIKRNTRRFAKRQFTWFRQDERLIWLDATPPKDPAQIVEEIVKGAEGKWSRGVEPKFGCEQRDQ